MLQPVLETGIGQLGPVPGKEGAHVQNRAEVSSGVVKDDLACVVAGGKARCDELVEPELLGPRHLRRGGRRSSDGDVSHRGGDVIRRDRLDEDGGQVDFVALGTGVGDALDEFEELRRVDDRVGDRGLLDQRLLGHLRPHITAVGQALGAYD